MPCIYKQQAPWNYNEHGPCGHCKWCKAYVKRQKNKKMTKQQIAKALGYTRVRITDAPRSGANLVMTIWKVPRRDGRRGKGVYRETINELPDFTSEQISKAKEIMKRNMK